MAELDKAAAAGKMAIIPKIAMWTSAIGFFGEALHFLFNEKQYDQAFGSLLKGLAAVGFGGLLHINSNDTAETKAKVDVVEKKQIADSQF